MAATCPLPHGGDGQILGLSAENTLYVEEYYDEDRLARHVLTLDGRILKSFDEHLEDSVVSTFPPLPDHLVRPAPIRAAVRLNFRGPRFRGLRELDRITDVVRPLEVPTRMELVARLSLDIPPFMLIGIAESQVLAEALLIPPHGYFVCRRIRLAYALQETRYDDDHQPFDYD
ncbi:MAG: hypothetical protein K8J31_19285, partial [Anaerolineae bacterium]|nr:hypothetical protein [Anaerolineae bacterium]